MTISELALDLATVAHEALTAASLTVQAPVLYHSPAPDEGECSDGRLVVWWSGITGVDRFPTPTAVVQCQGPPLLEVIVRWARCWPIEPQYVAEHSTIAGELLEGAWAVHQALTLEACGPTTVEQVSAGALALVSTTPRTPMGGVAAVDWKLRVRPYVVASS